MEDNRTDITIHQIPISVSFICPHCEAEIDINFHEFTKIVDDFPYWENENFECPECGEEIVVDNIEWD